MTDKLMPGISVRATDTTQGLTEGVTYRLLATEVFPGLAGGKTVYTLEKDGRHLLVMHVDGLLEEVYDTSEYINT